MKASDINPKHFSWSVDDRVATVALNRPERKNPLTFESYAELGQTFRQLVHVDDIKAVVFTGSGEDFCSGGDVHEIIGPLIKMEMDELLAFTRMTGELILSMRECPQPIIAAIDGICAGAGACVAMASDIRLGTARSKVAFLFNRVGLAGCDMGACAMLPQSSARAGRRSSCSPAVHWAVTRQNAGGFTTGWWSRRRFRRRRPSLPVASPMDRPSPMA